MKRPAGLLIDLDGTIWDEGDLVPGAAEAVAAIRAAGLPVRFVTNTTRVTRRTIAGWLADYGIEAEAADVFTPALAAAAWLQERGVRRIGLCLPPIAHEEFAAFRVGDEDPEAVVVGDMGAGWSYEVLNRAFRWIRDGAAFLALHRNRYWKSDGEWVLDAGAFVAGLEYATGRQATLVGKPSPPLFHAAAGSMGLAVQDVAMVGDSLRADVMGAQAAGALGVLVKTGNFRPDQLVGGSGALDLLIDSIAQLPDRL